MKNTDNIRCPHCAKPADDEVLLDRLRALHLGMDYARFKARKAELKAQIPVMERIANVTSITP